jgi:hypothetical protein
LATSLERSYPGAAASLREGLAEMFTVARLGIAGRLAKTLTTSNPIESMISIGPHHQPQRHPLARRAHGAALDRRRHAQRRTILPPHQGSQADAPSLGGGRDASRPERRIHSPHL